MAQWVTLFDDIDDDEFDGDVGENDEETPRIRIAFELANKVRESKAPQPTQADKKIK